MKNLATLFFSGIFCSLSAQADTTFLARSKAAALGVYARTVTTHSALFQGRAYKEYESTKEEHPYFLKDWTNGSVTFEGERYEDVMLLHDLSIDEIIVENPYANEPIQLAKDKVDGFTLGANRFLKISRKEMPAGYYLEVYPGSSQVITRTEKILQKRVYGKIVEYEFNAKSSYYVLRNGIYQAIKSKGALLNLLGDKKAELKKFIRSSKINFNQNRGKSIGQIAEYYDNLKG